MLRLVVFDFAFGVGAGCGQGDLSATEAAAQQHCPTDLVVWLNTASSIFHFRGERWYGRTNQGGYICERTPKATATGRRGTGNRAGARRPKNKKMSDSDNELEESEELELAFIVGLHRVFVELEAGGRFTVPLDCLRMARASGITGVDSERDALVARYYAMLDAGVLKFPEKQPSRDVLSAYSAFVDTLLDIEANRTVARTLMGRRKQLGKPLDDVDWEGLRQQYIGFVEDLERAIKDGVTGSTRVCSRAAVELFIDIHKVHSWEGDVVPLTLPAPSHLYWWDKSSWQVEDSDDLLPQKLYWSTQADESPLPVKEGSLTGYPVVHFGEHGRALLAESGSDTLVGVGWPCHLYKVAAVTDESCDAQFGLEVLPRGFTDVHGDSWNVTYPLGGRAVHAEAAENPSRMGRLFGSFVVLEELEPWQVFGPNGQQVAFAIQWWRGHTQNADKERRNDFINAVGARTRRVAHLRWGDSYPTPKTLFAPYSTPYGFEAAATWRFWLRPAPLVAAWIAASALSSSAGRFWAARYVAEACPGFVALVLRDVLEPNHFRELYSALEPFLPLSTLDAEIKPVGYRA